MAWPGTPLRTYVANSTPTIKASDLNNFQSGINGIINGTYSLAAFVVDGTGGAIVTPLSGSGTVSVALAGSATPNVAINVGQFGKAGVPIGFAYVQGATAALNNGYNVYSVARIGGTGEYTISFNPVPTSAAINFALASLGGIGVYRVAVGAGGGGRQAVNVYTYDLAGLATDINFWVGCWGE